MNRELVEFYGRSGAGIIDETDDWYWVRALNLFDMYVHKEDQSVTPCLVRDGFWESWITSYFIGRIGPGSVVLDVGANAGYYGLIANYYGAMVHAFEPNPRYADMIKATIERQNVSRMSIRVSQVAASDKKGTATLHIPKHLHGSASFTELDPKWESEPIEVRTQTLNVNAAGDYLVKIDAEGHEEKIWDGMWPTLKKRIGPIEIILEYTPGSYSDEFLDKLEEFAPLFWINHSGEPEPVTRDWLLNGTDWAMLTLKPSRRRIR